MDRLTVSENDVKDAIISIRTASRTGTTADASIPCLHHVQDFGTTFQCPAFAQSASHGTHEACEWCKKHDAGLLPQERFFLGTSPHPSTTVLWKSRHVKGEENGKEISLQWMAAVARISEKRFQHGSRF